MTPGQQVVLSLTFAVAAGATFPLSPISLENYDATSPSTLDQLRERHGDRVPVTMKAQLGPDARRSRESSAAAPRTESETPTAAPKSTPPRPRASKPQRAEPGVVVPAESGAPIDSTPTIASVPAPRAAERAPEGKAPGATDSVYVFAPQQAAVASRPAGPLPVAPRCAFAFALSARPLRRPRGRKTSPAPAGRLQLSVIASAPEIATGAIMTVDVMASSSQAVRGCAAPSDVRPERGGVRGRHGG